MSNHDGCIFIHSERLLILSVYVDDLKFFGPHLANIVAFKSEISKAFKMIDVGEVSYYLGMQVDQHGNGIRIHQGDFAKQVLRRHYGH
jgi:hypothetical protein